MKSSIKSPITFFGGKALMTKQIIQQFPDPSSYNFYLELFGGSGAVLLSRPLEYKHAELYNDIYENVYSLFKVISDKSLYEEFKFKCDLSLFSTQLRKEYIDKLKEKNLSMVDRAYYFFYVNRTSYSGYGGVSIKPVIRRGMAKSSSDFLSVIDKLKEFHDRLSSVIIENTSYEKLMNKYDKSESFFFLDPPYELSTRKSGGYVHDFKNEDQEKFIDICLNSNSKLLICGYACELYKKLETKFERVDITINARTGTNESVEKIESLWRNYEIKKPDNLAISGNNDSKEFFN